MNKEMMLKMTGKHLKIRPIARRVDYDVTLGALEVLLSLKKPAESAASETPAAAA